MIKIGTTVFGPSYGPWQSYQCFLFFKTRPRTGPFLFLVAPRGSFFVSDPQINSVILKATQGQNVHHAMTLHVSIKRGHTCPL